MLRVRCRISQNPWKRSSFVTTIKHVPFRFRTFHSFLPLICTFLLFNKMRVESLFYVKKNQSWLFLLRESNFSILQAKNIRFSTEPPSGQQSFFLLPTHIEYDNVPKPTMHKSHNRKYECIACGSSSGDVAWRV